MGISGISGISGIFTASHARKYAKTSLFLSKKYKKLASICLNMAESQIKQAKE